MMRDIDFAPEGLCTNSDYDPDWWFPVEKGGKSRWSRTPDAMKARSLCAQCPVLKECRDYAVQYEGIYGIWGGYDWHEMREARQRDNIVAKSWAMTYHRIWATDAK